MKWRKTMLECREYSYQELCSIFNTHDARSIKNRLTRWNVEYTYKGRGANLKFTIQNIHDPFRVFCILELSYSPQTDFRKLAYFLYYYMNDVEFYSLPCERQEQIMWMEGTPLTRQTIETYIQRLADNELILRASGNFRYYFALGDTIIDTDEETYKQAWHEYWIHIEIMPPQDAIWQKIWWRGKKTGNPGTKCILPRHMGYAERLRNGKSGSGYGRIYIIQLFRCAGIYRITNAVKICVITHILQR